jgi:hypothetical protein
MPKNARPQNENSTEIPWRDRPFQPVQRAEEITGISAASLYKFAKEGRLTFRRLGGRTLIETAGLIDLINSAEPWTPSARGTQARAARAESARAAWRG